MMRWGRKKSASLGSSSWLSKFGDKSNGGSGSKPSTEKKQVESWQNMSTRCQSEFQTGLGWKEAGKIDKEAGNRLREMMNDVQNIRVELQKEINGFSDIDAGNREKSSMITTPRGKKQQRDSVSLIHHQWQKLKETKLKEVKLKAEQQRKSMYISKELNRLRSKENINLRVYSPKASPRSEKCRIKAIEDLKKAKLRARERERGEGKEKESYAIVKYSRDPQKDFRDSMMEMITENGINELEELKELLVCYLTLNADEYHDMIINVLREVWGELNESTIQSVRKLT